MKTTRETAVLDYLKENKTITSMDMITLFGTTRPSDVIYEIRKMLSKTGEGTIKTNLIPFVSKYGGVHSRYAVYEYKESR